MIRYEIRAEGYFTPLTADRISELFAAGRLRRNDPCRIVGEDGWRTIDELFPLLKHEASNSLSPLPPGRRRSLVEKSDAVGDKAHPVSSALKAGWICCGLGLAVSWFFPFGNVFFSIAFITAVVAMCTHQVNRGLILLLSTFCATALCAFVFFALVVGTIGIFAAPTIQKMDSDLRKIQQAQNQAVNQVNAPAQLARSANSVASNAPALPTYSRGKPLTMTSRDSSASQQNQALLQANAATLAAERERARTREAVQQAERQRDAVNAKQQRIEQLQRSIGWNDHMAQDIRNHGGDPSIFEKQSEQLLRERWELQR